MPKLRDIIDRIKGEDLHQKLNESAEGSVCTEKTAALIRRAGAEGAVLLKNERNTLPLRQGEPVAVFGRTQIDWFFVGYGSGGNVLSEHRINLQDGLEQDGAALDPEIKEYYRSRCAKQKKKVYDWGKWPFSLPEAPVTREMIEAAAKRAETALVVLGRCAGEDLDMKDEPGSYRLTKEEERLLKLVSGAFKKTAVVLNTGNLIDLSSLINDPAIDALLVCWQGGQESGLAAADVLTGKVCPSGKLAASWAEFSAYPGMEEFTGPGEADHYTEDVFMGYRHFDSHRDGLIFPFGFGLSYTAFTFAAGTFTRENGSVRFSAAVKNTGACAGRETLQLYVRPPEGAPLTLIDYKKTRLLAPGEEETLTLSAADGMFASFDEKKHAFVLRAGEYRVFWGTDALTEAEAGRFTLKEELLIKQCAPLDDGRAFTAPEACAPSGVPVTVQEIEAGLASTDGLLAALTDEELEYLTHGEGYMESELGVSGNAGVMGGIIPSLREKGLRPLVTSDGPAGLRLNIHTSLFPSGTLLACTFDDALVEELLACMGEEAAAVGADIVLGPGLNLQRNPLNGRNFEYYSEDPLLSGRMAAAAVRGIQSAGVSACPKHFCCNNKENGRKYNSSDVSERALRELYLKNFEICLAYSDPLCLMTSYNRINGVSACYHYPLVTGILRNEWGYSGLIMTDWWMIYEPSPYFPALKNSPARIRAGVNVLMPGNRSQRDKKVHNDPETLAALKAGTLTRGELEKNARYLIELQLKLDGRRA